MASWIAVVLSAIGLAGLILSLAWKGGALLARIAAQTDANADSLTRLESRVGAVEDHDARIARIEERCRERERLYAINSGAAHSGR